jgi:hypothetical protein
MRLLVPPGVITLTVTLPVLAGVIKVREVEVITVAETVEPPIITEVLPATKLVPVTVTVVPPVSGPTEGVKEVAVGAFS